MSEVFESKTASLLRVVSRMRPLVLPYRAMQRILSYSMFVSDYRKFKRMNSHNGQRACLRWKDRLPCLGEQTAAHEIDRHYVYHLAWAARALAEMRPPSHVDISSSLHFCTILSAFVPVDYYEYRAVDLALSNLSCNSADLSELPFADGGVSSLSCMHVIEHIGLGRYGDQLDPDADLQAIAELKRVLAVGGSLLFVVPVGKPKIMFNAHRVYSYDEITGYFEGLDLREFALIPDKACDGGLIHSATRAIADQQSYGCGCFWFRKLH